MATAYPSSHYNASTYATGRFFFLHSHLAPSANAAYISKFPQLFWLIIVCCFVHHWPAIMADWVEQITAEIESSGPILSRYNDIMKILEDSLQATKQMLVPGMVMVHPSNRGSLGLNPFNVHRNSPSTSPCMHRPTRDSMCHANYPTIVLALRPMFLFPSSTPLPPESQPRIGRIVFTLGADYAQIRGAVAFEIAADDRLLVQHAHSPHSTTSPQSHRILPFILSVSLARIPSHPAAALSHPFYHSSCMSLASMPCHLEFRCRLQQVADCSFFEYAGAALRKGEVCQCGRWTSCCLLQSSAGWVQHARDHLARLGGHSGSEEVGAGVSITHHACTKPPPCVSPFVHVYYTLCACHLHRARIGCCARC